MFLSQIPVLINVILMLNHKILRQKIKYCPEDSRFDSLTVMLLLVYDKIKSIRGSIQKNAYLQARVAI